jgi:glycosyltransferase involved in cell wall biosynthesis
MDDYILSRLIKEKNIMITVILLNWKRPENLKKIIKSLRSQTIPVEIFLWNNNKDDTFQYEVDLQINSSKNLKCWARWFLINYSDNEYVCVMDDDLIMDDHNVLKECLEYVENNDVSIGRHGVILNDERSYWDSPHVSPSNSDINVDILKGRFIFLKKRHLHNLGMFPEISFQDCRIEDDIIISSILKRKIIPSFLKDGFSEMPANDSLYHQSSHAEARTETTKKYF